MILLGNTPVLTTVYQIMVTLQRELKLSNSLLLQTVLPQKYPNQDIQFTCPFHKNGLEGKPSCGITTVEKKRGETVIPIGSFHCFSCSAHGDITELISYCFGKQDGGIFGRKWILDHFNNYEIENRSGFFKKLGEVKQEIEPQYIKEEELAQYRFIHPYMYKRHLTNELIDIYDIGYDKSFRLKEELKSFSCITFPVRDENGNVVFIARRSTRGKIFHYLNNVDKPIYGLWEVNHLFPNSKELFICESILNALMLVKWGKPAVALLGTGSYNQIKSLRSLDYRKYILCLDSDEAGEKGTKKLYNALCNYKLLQIFKMPRGKDINDLGYCKTYEEFLEEKEKEGI